MLYELIKQGGIALIPLGFCSVLVVAVILERIWSFTRVGDVPRELMRRVENLITGGNWQEAVRLLDDTINPYTRVAKASLMRKNASQQEIADILTLASDAEIAAVSRPLPILGTIGNIAPFIGLFGTVIGIMEAFQRVAVQGAAGAAVVSSGISQALIATACGLAVGICSVVANNWCNAWVEGFRLTLERFCTEWSYRLHELQQQAPATEESAV